MAWLTRFGGTFRGDSSPGIAYQGSLANVPLSMSVGDTAIAAPSAALVMTPRTAVTGAQQSQNVNAALPIFQPGDAPTNSTNQVPKNEAMSGIVIGGIIIFALLMISGIKVK